MVLPFSSVRYKLCSPFSLSARKPLKQSTSPSPADIWHEYHRTGEQPLARNPPQKHGQLSSTTTAAGSSQRVSTKVFALWGPARMSTVPSGTRDAARVCAVLTEMIESKRAGLPGFGQDTESTVKPPSSRSTLLVDERASHRSRMSSPVRGKLDCRLPSIGRQTIWRQGVRGR